MSKVYFRTEDTAIGTDEWVTLEENGDVDSPGSISWWSGGSQFRIWSFKPSNHSLILDSKVQLGQLRDLLVEVCRLKGI